MPEAEPAKTRTRRPAVEVAAEKVRTFSPAQRATLALACIDSMNPDALESFARNLGANKPRCAKIIAEVLADVARAPRQQEIS